MSIATLIRRMSDAGAPPEAIALAVEEIEALQAALDARRGADRDRKRAQRERQKTADVTGQSEDSHGTVTGQVTPPPVLEVSPEKPLPNPAPITPLKSPSSRKAKPVEVPDWMPSEPWTEFVAMRRSMRQVPFTDAAQRNIIAELGKLRLEGHDPERLLKKSVARGYRGIFPDTDTKAGVRSTGPPSYLDHVIERDRAAGVRQ